ncbi:MAG: InlB B-repeat-containing protein [Oscillospiraceae bacterium]|nr:InlB B-repeat-containing protein [Oscillospiraceae bacterium]
MVLTKNSFKKMVSVTLAALITLSLLTAGVPTFAADPVELDLTDGDVVISSTGYTQGSGSFEAWTDDYVLTSSGTTSHTITAASGTHQITLDGIDIDTTGCAFSIEMEAEVTLTLADGTTNTLTSGPGYAGIYVSTYENDPVEAARLTIDGEGTLIVKGGDSTSASTTGGAGIGGNGHINGVSSDDVDSFGVITIEGGSITATGGSSSGANYGAGAGIGSGGIWGGPYYPEGTIIINGGMVSATGGTASNDAGGAGIGSGGSSTDWSSLITVTIAGGIVNAEGGACAAGIGGGNNVSVMTDTDAVDYSIEMTGGTIIANGTGSTSAYGGAGIGGGDNGFASNIHIGGDAVVEARGAGAAAGIGGGRFGGVWNYIGIIDEIGEILIDEHATVSAYGSSGISATYGAGGGAGIGAGYDYITWNTDPSVCNSGSITIADNANVTAYGGKGAQALGVGYNYQYDSSNATEHALKIGDNVTLRLFNYDTTRPAYGPSDDSLGVDITVPDTIISYTHDDVTGANFPAADTSTDTTDIYGDPVTPYYTWAYSSTDLSIYHDQATTRLYATTADQSFQNWAVLNLPYTVTYDANGGTGAHVDYDIPYGNMYQILSSDDAGISYFGYYFLEWNTEPDGSGTRYFANDVFTVKADITLYAQWSEIVLVPSPVWTVTYNANGGTGIHADTVADGYLYTVLTLGGTGITRSGYIFTGWSTDPDGSTAGVSYAPDDTVTVTSNITLYAQWSKNAGSSATGGSKSTESSSDLTVTYHWNDGRDSDVYLTQSVSSGATATRPTNPVRSGCAFGGWYLDADCTDTYDFDAIVTANLDLYAMWTQTFSEAHYAYLIGYPDNTVRPEGNITRAEVATIFFRLISDSYREQMWQQSNPFGDVTLTDWDNNAVSTMYNAGIINGYPTGDFAPNASITRAEFAAIAARFSNASYSGSDLFPDISGHWAAKYINIAAELGWVAGYQDGTFRPDAYITRAEVATLIDRVTGRHLEDISDLLTGMVTFPDNMDQTTWYYLDIQEAINSHQYTRTETRNTNSAEAWSALMENRDWKLLERSTSSPSDIY